MQFRELPTNHQAVDAPVRYRVTGELVPILEFSLEGTESVFFEHYVLLYREPSVVLKASAPKGALKRMISQMPVFLATARGHGRLALSRDGVGQLFGVQVAPNSSLDVREHQFVAATAALEYGFTRVRGLSNLLFGGNSFFVDQFVARREAGVVWLHAYGNLTEVYLADGEMLDVEPGSWCYKDHSVKMTTIPVNVSAGLFASTSFTLNRFHGPGRLGIQSMAVYLPTSE